MVCIARFFACWRPAAAALTSPLRSAKNLTDLYWLNNLHAEDFRMVLHLLQTEKPVFWDTSADCIRTAHPQSLDAEPVGDQEGR